MLAGVFWGVVFQRVFGAAARRGSVGRTLLGAAAVSGIAYVTDYYLVPGRVTPRFEKRVSGAYLAAVYSILALAMGSAALLR